MARRHAIIGLALLLAASALVAAPPSAVAAVNPFPHEVRDGFATQTGAGFYSAYADGTVTSAGNAVLHGDESGASLTAPIQGGASTATGSGYWLVASDGGVFTFGNAVFYGSMGGQHLNAPVVGMARTETGHGYWLVASDGGIFTFGDGGFFGSAGGITLTSPIVGMTASPSGNGYRLVAADGGIFSYGDSGFYGSVPSKDPTVRDVVGMAATPTNKGYWIVRRGGQIYAFGDAVYYGNYTPPACDQVVGIIGNPVAKGYRLLTESGATIPFGTAPGGSAMTGAPQWCVQQSVCQPALNTAANFRALLDTRGPVWTGGDGGGTVLLGDGRRLWLFGDTFSGPTDATTILPGYKEPHNSIAIQQGTCFDYRFGGPAGNATDFLPPPAANHWYLPAAAVVDKAHGVIYVTAFRQNAGSFERFDLLTLDYYSLAFRSATPMPTGGGKLWGASMWQIGQYVYVVAHPATGSLVHYMARTTLDHLGDGQGWSFSTGGNSWSTNGNAAQPMSFRNNANAAMTAPQSGIWVAPYASGYILSSTSCDELCADQSPPVAAAWYSTTPAGPWRAVNNNAAFNGNIGGFTLPAGQGAVVYGAHLVSTNAGWLIFYSQNGADPPAHKNLYGVKVQTPVNLPAQPLAP